MPRTVQRRPEGGQGGYVEWQLTYRVNYGPKKTPHLCGVLLCSVTSDAVGAYQRSRPPPPPPPPPPGVFGFASLTLICRPSSEVPFNC